MCSFGSLKEIMIINNFVYLVYKNLERSKKLKLYFFAISDPDQILSEFMVKIGPNAFKCAGCQADGFKFSSNLRAHIEAKHYSPGYTCSMCRKVFRIRKAYTQHLKKCRTLHQLQ